MTIDIQEEMLLTVKRAKHREGKISTTRIQNKILGDLFVVGVCSGYDKKLLYKTFKTAMGNEISRRIMIAETDRLTREVSQLAQSWAAAETDKPTITTLI